MIIVTGASKGLGKAIAQRLYQKKHRIIGISRSIKDHEYGIEHIACDVGDYESVKNAVRKIKNKGASKCFYKCSWCCINEFGSNNR